MEVKKGADEAEGETNEEKEEQVTGGDPESMGVDDSIKALEEEKKESEAEASMAVATTKATTAATETKLARPRQQGQR